MRQGLKRKGRLTLFGGFIMLVIASMVLQCQLEFPSRIILFEGEQWPVHSGSAYSIDMPASMGGVLSETGSLEADRYRQSLSLEKTNEYNMTVKLFGFIPVRSVSVSVEPKMELAACGNTIGIKIFTEGLVCVGTQEIKDEDGHRRDLSREADIRAGDIFLTANKIELIDTEQMSQLINKSGGTPMQFTVRRNDEIITKDLTPLKTDEGYKLGIWLRDSTAGIGTLTFYDPKTNNFGALGHPITDTDTGTLMPVSKGALLKARVLSVQKGKKGEPGELKGIFQTQESDLGIITQNNQNGVFGSLTEKPEGKNVYPVASGSQIQEGPATILSNIEGDKVEEFAIEIQKTPAFYSGEHKDMIIHVPDPVLLERSGGIVQGMRGSPIIQNGKIVGAVTHVFVNDPTRGYGIFIEKMLEHAS